MRMPLLGLSLLVSSALFLAEGCAVSTSNMGIVTSGIGFTTSQSSLSSHLVSTSVSQLTDCELWDVKSGVVRATEGCLIDVHPARPSLTRDLFLPIPFKDERMIRPTCPTTMAGSC